MQDFLDDPGATNPGQAVDQHLLRERIAEVLRSLTPREREVIELRFGLRDGQPRTLDEVARAYGITRERIRQIEARGLLKLRQPLRSQRLAELRRAMMMTPADASKASLSCWPPSPSRFARLGLFRERCSRSPGRPSPVAEAEAVAA